MQTAAEEHSDANLPNIEENSAVAASADVPSVRNSKRALDSGAMQNGPSCKADAIVDTADGRHSDVQANSNNGEAESTPAPSEDATRQKQQQQQQQHLELERTYADAAKNSMTPTEIRMLEHLQNKFAACKLAKQLYNEPTKGNKAATVSESDAGKEQPPPTKTPQEIVEGITTSLKWADDDEIHPLSCKEKASDLMHQWQILLEGEPIVDGTIYMNYAIQRVISMVQPQQLQQIIMRAAHTGTLKYGDPQRTRMWRGKALWHQVPAIHLVLDAAGAYDKVQEIRREFHKKKREEEQLLCAQSEFRFHVQHHGQVHATATLFEPQPKSSLSDDDILDMDYDSDEEALAARILLDAIENMVTEKRTNAGEAGGPAAFSRR